MNISPVFKNFALLLDERLRAGVFTTEDSVRHTFFHALLTSGFCKHSEIILEMRHMAIPKAEIDLFIQPGDQHPANAFEFKYDRPIPSEKHAPRTQKAGAVFKDLFRLARIPVEKAPDRYFIYLTASEMADYFHNPANGLNSFFELPEDQSFLLTSDFISSKAETFRTALGNLFLPIKVLCVCCRNISAGHALRIYRVES